MLTGSWTGTLQYRDYRSDKRVTLPTQLEIGGIGGELTFAYTYDDGPGKTVRSQDRITIDNDRSTYRVQASEGNYDATFSITDRVTASGNMLSFTLVGKGEENGAAVDLRMRYVLTPSTLQVVRESRLPGGDWLFRHEYRLSRRP